MGDTDPAKRRSLTGAGQTRIASGGTIAIDAAANVAATNVELDGNGTLTGAGTLTVNGTLLWTGGTMSGSGSTVVSSGATLTLNTFVQTLSGRTLTNAGADPRRYGFLFGPDQRRDVQQPTRRTFSIQDDSGLRDDTGARRRSTMQVRSARRGEPERVRFNQAFRS